MTNVDDISALCVAVARRDVDGVRRLLEAGVSPNAPCPASQDRQPPLHLAVLGGKPEIAQMLVDYGAKIEARDRVRDTALHAAARAWPGRTDLESIEVLLRAGADPNTRHRRFDPAPLHLAVWADAADLARTLLAHGADPNAVAMRPGWRYTSLHVVRSSATAAALLEAGADPRRSEGGALPLVGIILSARRFSDASDRLATVRLLLEHGSPVDDPPQLCGLGLAASTGDLALVELLLEAGADPCCCDEQGTFVLEHALREDTAILERLLAAGADPTADHLLHDAARIGSTRAVEVLLAAGADPNRTDALGQRPLDVAVEPEVAERLRPVTTADAAPSKRRRTKAVPPSSLHVAITRAHETPREELLAQVDAFIADGTPVDARDRDGFTALELAIDRGLIDVVERLLAAGADPEAAAFDEAPPIARAAVRATESRQREILKRLLDHGADPRRRYGGRTLLHDLALVGDAEAIAIARAAGADANARDEAGLRPRDWATDPKVAALLR